MLPFVLGVAVGAGAVFAYKNSGKIKTKACELANRTKTLATDSVEKSKSAIGDAKDTISATKECIIEKKAQKKELAKEEDKEETKDTKTQKEDDKSKDSKKEEKETKEDK